MEYILLIWFNDSYGMKSGWRTLKKKDFSPNQWSYLVNLSQEYKHKHLQISSTLPFVINLTEDPLYTNVTYRPPVLYNLPLNYSNMGIIIGYM